MSDDEKNAKVRVPAATGAAIAGSRAIWSPAFNVPNTLCAVRLLGSLVLVYLAVAQEPVAFLWLFVFLIVTDWLDGKLAILLNQRTEFGARLDSIADATLYTALLFGLCWLKWQFVVRQWVWLAAALTSYAITSLAGLIKFHRLPSYHTWGAKTSTYLATIAAICLFADWAVWPFHVAAAAVMLTNMEATVITFILPRWQADVRSWWHALRIRRATPGRGDS